MERSSLPWYFMLPIGLALVLNLVSLSLVHSQLKKLSQQLAYTSQEAENSNNGQIMERLDLIQAQLAQLQSANGSALGAATPTIPGQLSDLLPDISYDASSASKRYVSIAKDLTIPVKVYKEQADFSAMVGQLVPDYKYPASAKLNNWYKVELSDDISGWVKADYVQEVL